MDKKCKSTTSKQLFVRHVAKLEVYGCCTPLLSMHAIDHRLLGTQCAKQSNYKQLLCRCSYHNSPKCSPLLTITLCIKSKQLHIGTVQPLDIHGPHI